MNFSEAFIRRPVMTVLLSAAAWLMVPGAASAQDPLPPIAAADPWRPTR